MVEVVDSLKQFVRASHAKQVVMKIVAFSLSPADINSLRDAFHSIDTDRNGSISMRELHDSIRSFKGIPVESIDRHCEQSGANMNTMFSKITIIYIFIYLQNLYILFRINFR